MPASPTPELRQMRYFVAVAEELHFGRAAARLHIAQPALSQQIRRLEALLGVKLLNRTPQRVRLTDAGTIFLEHARETIAQAERASEAARRAARGETGVVLAGFLHSTVTHVMPPIVRSFRRRWPEIRLQVSELPIAELVEGLQQDRLDVAVSRPPMVDGLRCETLLCEDVGAVTAEDHPLAARRSLSLDELAGERWVLTSRSGWAPWQASSDDRFAAAGFQPNVVERPSSLHSLLGLVAAGVGVTRMPRSTLGLGHAGLAFVPLRNDTAYIMLLRRPGIDKPSLENFCAVARDVATELASAPDGPWYPPTGPEVGCHGTSARAADVTP